MIELQYPIGKFKPQESYTQEEIKVNIGRIAALPNHLANAIAGFNDSQFDTPYRDGGWTVRQVVHHVSDSHLNAYIRFKWTLTESNPTIKAYDEKLWATTPEVKGDPLLSLEILKAHHKKWVALLNSLSNDDLQKFFIHPETGRQVKLMNLIALYAWHGEHHVAHIISLKSRMGWK